MKSWPIFVCGLLVCLTTMVAGADEQRPNLVFMFADDQAPNCLGVMGNDKILTPNIDSLARRGVVFNNAFATTAICCSNRACILTGQHMMRHGIEDFVEPLSAEAFEQTYPALLRKAGYRTGFLGKYAVGNPAKHPSQLCLPADKFDYWYGFPQSIDFRQMIDGEPQYLTEVMTEKAIEFLQQSSSSQPFCLTVAFKEPHGPFNYFDPNVPDPYASAELPASPTCTKADWEGLPEFLRSSLGGNGAEARIDNGEGGLRERRTVYRMISRMDTAVGKIMAELERLKLDQNTIVIYSSDHGSLLGDHGLSGKWLMYENSIRVPMIIFDPRKAASGQRGRRNEMVLSIDLAPTMLAVAGVEIPATMQGQNLMALVNQESVEWRSHFYYQHTYQTEPPRAPIPRTEGIRTERWKYIRYPDTVPVYEQLFDLNNDSLERNNLVADARYAERLTELRKKCDAAPLELK